MKNRPLGCLTCIAWILAWTFIGYNIGQVTVDPTAHPVAIRDHVQDWTSSFFAFAVMTGCLTPWFIWGKEESKD